MLRAIIASKFDGTIKWNVETAEGRTVEQQLASYCRGRAAQNVIRPGVDNNDTSFVIFLGDERLL